MIAADRLQEFGSLTLDQLDAAANLLTRVDRKYIVEADRLAGLLDDHRSRLRVLEIDGDRSFRYTSTYFDTDRLDLHRWAATGRSHRAKVRVRVCESSLGPTAVMLEVKTKDGRGATVKRRQQHPIAECHELGPSGVEFVDEATGRLGLGASLVPVLTTSYWRSTFVDPVVGTRATIDTGLECRHVSGRSVALSKAIVETKSRLAPSDLDRWMWRNGNRPERISKYCTAMALIDPALPGNRWNRTVNRHFDISGTDPVGR